MPWFMVDDSMPADEKVLALDMEIRAEAIGTWTLCGAWSSQRLKDGNVPTGVVTAIGGTIRGADALVDVALWKSTKTGYKFNNWAKFQRTKAEIMKKRDDESERKRKYREAKSQQTGGNVPDLSQRDTRHVPPVSGPPIPAHPSPSHPLKDSNQVGEVKSPKQGAGSDPTIQPCGTRHDASRPCAGCKRANEKAEQEATEARRKAAATKRAQDLAARQSAIAACDACDDQGRTPGGKPCAKDDQGRHVWASDYTEETP